MLSKHIRYPFHLAECKWPTTIGTGIRRRIWESTRPAKVLMFKRKAFRIQSVRKNPVHCTKWASSFSGLWFGGVEPGTRDCEGRPVRLDQNQKPEGELLTGKLSRAIPDPRTAGRQRGPELPVFT